MIRLIFVLAALAFALPASGAEATPGDALVGLWAHETAYEARLKGTLTVVRERETWRASISNVETKFDVTGNAVRFSFPGGLGEFRGAPTEKGSIVGFWVQPGGGAEDGRDPGGASQPFASRLMLERASSTAWQGAVQPLKNSFTLYLKIYRNADGKLVGAFRNPEMNSNGGSTLFDVARSGDDVRISLKPDPAMPEIRVDAKFLAAPDRLQINWSDIGRTIELTRRAPEQVPAFFPRPPGENRYVYRAPAATGDGWKVGRGAGAGMDEAALTRLVQRLIDADPAVRRAPLIHSVLVARRGKLVLEEYFFGHRSDTLHDTRSAAKTFSSVMLGAIMRRGVKVGPETKIYDLMAKLGPFANPDPRKSQITLAQLMTHSAGLACDDNLEDSPGNEATMWKQRGEPNWWKYTLDLPMSYNPGKHYAYCSANINLVGGALTTATGTWLPALFDETVAGPLQFGDYYWPVSPAGDGYLGGGAFLRPRDLLKLGQTYLDGGVWNGRRIVDATWVERSTAPQIELSPATTGLGEEEFSNSYIKGAAGYSSDGYAWHLVGIRSGGRVHREYDASGNGGQLLIVVPELDLAVVLMGGNYLQGGIWNRWRDDIVGAEIIPAIR